MEDLSIVLVCLFCVFFLVAPMYVGNFLLWIRMSI